LRLDPDRVGIHAGQPAFPIAHDLHLTEGTAGQAIAISGLFAVITSLCIARISSGSTGGIC
jgi:hypothetical protein